MLVTPVQFQFLFGSGNPDLVETVSITKLQAETSDPGMPVELDDRKGVADRVIGQGYCRLNNPLAGKTVSYEYTIEYVLEADVEKIQGLLALIQAS